MAQAQPALEKTAEYKLVPIAEIMPSKTNPRTHFNDEYLQQLGQSIAEKGIVEPLIVRSLRGKLEIVAGECRYRASKLASQTHLPCIVRSLTDEQALEIQIIENLHRKDLTPLEEAAGFRALIKTNPDKHSATTIAGRIGKSPSWVWDLMKLLDLVPEAKEILEQGLMSLNHAILIARLKPKEQKRAIRPDGGGLFTHEHVTTPLDFEADKDKKPGEYDKVKARTVRELNEWINDHIRFDVKQAAQAAPLLFETVAEKIEEAAARPGRGKKVVPITRDSYVQPEAKDGERTFTERSWRRADGTEKTTHVYPNKWLDSPTCEHSVLGCVVVGPGQGEAFEVCIARDRCEVHWGKEIKAKASRQRQTAAGNGSSPAEAKRVAEFQREQEQRRQKQERWTVLGPRLKKATFVALEKVPTDKPLPKAVYQHLLGVLRLPLNTKPDQLAHALLRKQVSGTFSYIGYESSDMSAWAKALGVDVKALETAKARVQTSGEKRAKKVGDEAA
jgi:ParB/RepB/Spo0J family partition protein